MQPGSGTPDLIVGSSYTYKMGSWVQSARGQITARGWKNDEGWNLGTEYQANLSSKYQLNPYLKWVWSEISNPVNPFKGVMKNTKSTITTATRQ